MVWLFALTLVMNCGFGQPIPPTNYLTGAQVVEIASHLAPGMLESNAHALLAEKGLKGPPGPWPPVGPYGTARYYILADGSALVVGCSAPPSRSNVWTNGVRFLGGKNVTVPIAVNNVWANMRVRVAFLQTNALHTVFQGSARVLEIIPPAPKGQTNRWTTADDIRRANYENIAIAHTNEP